MSRIGITGHQQLSLATEQFVSNKLHHLLETEGELIGITSLAAGADQLFARTVLDLGGTLTVIVPAQTYREAFSNGDDLLAYEFFLAKAREVIVLPFDVPTETAFMAAGREVVQRSDRLIAIWDGQPARGLGGTADVVKYAREKEVPVLVVWPSP